VEKEAKSSKKSRSEAKEDIRPVGEVTRSDTKERTESAIRESEKVASGEGVEKAKKKDLETDESGEVVAGQEQYSLPHGYDPYTDPVIPSSAVAATVATELRSLGESPTLKALHAGRDSKTAFDKKSYRGIAGSDDQKR
jgi:hypothetical protein